MGVSLAWIAARGAPSGDFLKRLQLTPTGDFEEIPESPYSACTLETGWLLVVVQRMDDRAVAPETLRAVSSGAELVVAWVEEHVMFSRAEGWKDGQKTWSIVHESEKGPTHLESTGAPPVSLAGHQTKALDLLKAEGEDSADYVFDVPLQVAQELTGFKHDEGPDRRFEVLKKAPGSGGFLNRLFGSK